MAFGLAGCIAAPPGFRGGEGQFSRGERDYEERIKNDRDRESVLRRSSDRYSSRKRCSSESSCKNICDDIYDRRRDKQDCEALPLPQVEALNDVYKALKSPDYDDLIDIDRDDFDVLINISIKPYDKLIRKYNRQESRETLRWIASDSDIAEVFKKEDDEHSNMDKLLKKIDSSDLFEALKEHIYSGHGFLSLAVEEGNEEAAELVHLLLESKGPSECKDQIAHESCFRKYCELGASMDSSNAEDLMDFDYFHGYLEDIISDEENKNNWETDIQTKRNNNVLEADDLDKWWEELC